MSERRSWLADLGSIALIVVLMASVYLLPPDTSLREVRESGTISACVPPDYPPLVQRDTDAPGFEVDLLGELARRMEVRLLLSTNAAIARDFNPRSWRISRAHCQVIAGGVTDTQTTRIFLDTTTPHLQSGWAVLAAGDIPANLAGLELGFLAGLTGLNRVELSREIRARGASVTIANSEAELLSGLRSGRFAGAVTEALSGSVLARREGLSFSWFDAERRVPIALGLWKGDLTLKRQIVRLLEEMESDGRLDALRARYGVSALEAGASG